MKSYFSPLVSKILEHQLAEAHVIPWASPIPIFGKVAGAKVGTLGLNPSNREFVDSQGQELAGDDRRFHTLSSLGLKNWEEIEDIHLEKMAGACEHYFHSNPYNNWFQELDVIINGLGSSYYGNAQVDACHLDLIPFATSCKWTALSEKQRKLLLEVSDDAFAHILKDSEITLLVLNGMSVIRYFESISNVNFEVQEMSDWTLSRNGIPTVKGVSYAGFVSKIDRIDLEREVYVLGFNHNLQSSFGVTNKVKSSIRRWIANTGMEMVA